MEEILLFLRTSLRKNPEEWFYVEQYQSIGFDNSTMNLFVHEPTGYVLFLITSTPLPHGDQPPKKLYYVSLMDEDEYVENIESSAMMLSRFSPNPDFAYLVNENSSIIKTLNFIKYMSLEDEKLLKYENFKNYIREKNKPNEPEPAKKKEKSLLGRKRK
jgi:hypothetical protein